MSTRSLDQWLVWLENHHPKDIDLGLSRIAQVAERLELLSPGDYPTPARTVTIAGTNGKGSCVAATAYLLRQAGFSVGVYTSPHFIHYCERIVIDGQQASEREVCEAFELIEQARAEISLSYFEFGTLAALEIFRRRGVDIMVLEVGLGGRLDAINIIDADVAVVTTVAIDHQDWLGSEREAIGREKAAICRLGRPLICADSNPTASISMVAASTGAQLQQLGLEFFYQQERESWSWQGQSHDGGRYEFAGLPLPQLPLPSVAAALQVVASLGVTLESLWLQAGLAAVALPGRFQQLKYRGRQLILDVAHNPAAAAYLADKLALRPQADSGRTLAITAMMSDKDIEGTLTALSDSVDHWLLADLPDLPRAALAAELELSTQSLGLSAEVCGSVANALDAALAMSEACDRILVVGSFFTVAELLELVDAG